MKTHLVWRRWETFGRRPYFANLTAMGLALDTLRARVAAVGGDLRVFVFLDDRLEFLAEGPAGRLGEALDEGRDEAGTAFLLRDGKPLWGTVTGGVVEVGEQAAALAAVLRLPQEAGLADGPQDYPWIGGSWFSADGGTGAA